MAGNPNHDKDGRFAGAGNLREQIKTAMSYAAKGNSNTAQRMINAESKFAESLMERAGISKEDAYKAIAGFRKAKVLKMDAVGGHMTVKHGAYLEPDVIKRAIDFK